jgi:autotransporter-associated beta strand protein
VTFLSGSSARWTFDPDSSGGSDSKVVDLNPPPSSGGMPAPPTYQLSRTFTSGNSSSTAKGSIGFIVNSTTATFTLAAGSGVTQSDPNNANYKGDSVMRVGFGGLFQATSPSFGPVATGYVSIAVGGTVGTGGRAQFISNISFRNEANNVSLRPDVNFNQTFTSAGTFTKVFTSSAVLNPSTVSNGTKFRVNGFFEFRASNHGAPSGIVPLDIDIGAAPPTATWYINQSGNWNNGTNWTPPAGSIIDNPDEGGGGDGGDGSIILTSSGNHHFPNNPPPPPPGDPAAVPNGIGQRARFATFVNNKSVTLTDDVTLGVIDVNATGGLNFKTNNNKKFILDTFGDNASINTHDVNGTNRTTFDTAIQLNQDLELITDGTYIPGMGGNDPRSKTSFNKSINGNHFLTKDGDGESSFNARNNYTGGTFVKNGKLFANTAGALGEGYVDVGAYLGYNARYAAKQGQQVFVFDGGQLDLGVTPGNNENFFVTGLSALSGNSQVLSSITVDVVQGEGEGEGSGDFVNGVVADHFQHHPTPPPTNANIALAAGAMIGHKDWDTGPRGNPRGLGNTPLFIFGISNDFDHSGFPHGLTFGSDSNSPWVGFGSDRIERIFGNNPRSNRDVLRVAGYANLVSLNETLWLNAKLDSVNDSAVLEKVGNGVVSIENTRNGFNGSINVYEGMLQVNGNLPAVQHVSVYNSALGGKGYIGGDVYMGFGSSLNPGSNKPTDRVGTLRVKSLALSDSTELNFDLGRPGFAGHGINDLVDVDGDLLLDGIVNIFDTGEFNAGTYILFEFGGALDDQGLTFGNVPNTDFLYAIDVVGDQVLLHVGVLSPILSIAPIPEPASAGLLLIGAAGLMRRRRRSK